jgi:hypothetical protein
VELEHLLQLNMLPAMRLQHFLQQQMLRTMHLTPAVVVAATSCCTASCHAAQQTAVLHSKLLYYVLQSMTCNRTPAG